MPFVKYPAETKLMYVHRLLAGDAVDRINSVTGLSPREDTLATWIELFQATRSVVANPDWYERRGAPRKLTPDQRNFLLEVIEVDPTLYLNEIAAQLATHGIRIGVQTLLVELRDRLGLTLKVALTVDPAQDEMERAQFIYDVRNIPVECFIAFDESHLDGAKLHRPRARAPKGLRTRRLPKPTRAHRFTLLAAMSLDGAMAAKTVTGPVSRPTIEDFFEKDLLPVTSPFPAPNSVILMDNATIHKGGDLADLCDDYGVRIQYLPRYSPDFNPIEKGFNVIKMRFRREHTLDWHRGLNVNEAAEAIYLTTLKVLSAPMARSLFEGSIYL